MISDDDAVMLYYTHMFHFYAYVIPMFCLLCADAIEKIYDSDKDVPLTQMVLQRTIGVITQEEDMEDDEEDKDYKYCVVIVEDLDDEENEDLDYEDNVESKCKYFAT